MSTDLHKSWIAGVFAAFSASLCCIVPVVALIGGAGGVSTYFNWVEPYRPYIIGPNGCHICASLVQYSCHQISAKK